MGKLRLEDLIAKAGENKIITKDIRIESLGGDITIKNIDEKTIFRGLDRLEGDNLEMQEVMNLTEEMIYHSCEILKSPELQEAYGCAEPYDIVSKLFTISERNTLFAEILTISGFEGMDIDEMLKKE